MMNIIDQLDTVDYMKSLRKKKHWLDKNVGYALKNIKINQSKLGHLKYPIGQMPFHHPMAQKCSLRQEYHSTETSCSSNFCDI